ncbi:MAG TPA: hypothetical protein VFI24_24460 [Pyrinomonadaceae bacterium]|nr:hypothetical protein [Pyrinomonadaceae bacterium]
MRKKESADNSRREFLKISANAIAGIGCLSLTSRAQPLAINPMREDAPDTHNMMLVGAKTAFLSHLPMFVNSGVGPEFDSHHRFQVILEATFTNEDRDLTESYFKDRMKNPAVKMYTLNPGLFVLSHVDPNGSALKKFRGNAITRGHLERGGTSIIGDLENPPNGGAFDVNVVNVVHFREFDPNAVKPAKLEYLLFGKGSELFLAHLITKPNDFDQIISIKTTGQSFTDEELAKGMHIEFADRGNTSKERLKEKVKASGRLIIPGADSRTVPIETVREFYFEEGELFAPPTFKATAEEKKSGFQ